MERQVCEVTIGNRESKKNTADKNISVFSLTNNCHPRNMSCSLSHIQSQIAIGNEKALAELYQLLNRKLHHFAKAITRSNELAEEVVEDVFVRLWSNRQTIMEIDNLNVYLYVAVKNKSLNCISQKTKELIKAPFDDLDIEIGNVSADPYDLLVTSLLLKVLFHHLRHRLKHYM